MHTSSGDYGINKLLSIADLLKILGYDFAVYRSPLGELPIDGYKSDGVRELLDWEEGEYATVVMTRDTDHEKLPTTVYLTLDFETTDKDKMVGVWWEGKDKVDPVYLALMMQELIYGDDEDG